jgi:hypothetical protein
MLIGFSDIVSLNRLPSISFKQELPHFLVIDVEIILVILVRLNILINEL